MHARYAVRKKPYRSKASDGLYILIFGHKRSVLAGTIDRYSALTYREHSKTCAERREQFARNDLCSDCSVFFEQFARKRSEDICDVMITLFTGAPKICNS